MDLIGEADYWKDRALKAEAALRAAEGEPCAWMLTSFTTQKPADNYGAEWTITPLYARPAPRT